MSDKQAKNPMVHIAGIIGVLSVGVVAITSMRGGLNYGVWVVGLLTLMGTVLGVLAYKQEVNK